MVEIGGKYGYEQMLFFIVQGSIYFDLCCKLVEMIVVVDQVGNVIGGFLVGEFVEVMYEIIDQVCYILFKDKLCYLMGVGILENIFECIVLGVDMFDCVLFIWNVCYGMFYILEGIINIKNVKWKDDFSLVDVSNFCYVSQ